MRPSTTVARAALTAALALGALPGLVGSHEPSQDRPIEAALFGQVYLATTRAGAARAGALARRPGVTRLVVPAGRDGRGDAAAALERLADAIERNPSSLLVGKKKATLE